MNTNIDKIIRTLLCLCGIGQMIVMAILILIVFYETLVDEQISNTVNFEVIIVLFLLFAIGIMIFRTSRRKPIEIGNDSNTANKSNTSLFFLYLLKIGGACIIVFFSGWYIWAGLNFIVDSHFDNTGLLPLVMMIFIPGPLVGIGLYMIGKRIEAQY
ncbi:MAG: hypothetical protein P8I94_08215 [Emcibacteraceae bacterium]|nr:hypothetical protein [Emcibacteraceae bacterium]